ncbi:uncharacterized protein LOC110686882 [Chenopodium quinoa]|uniref:uncharacterized protein LOC110686882 n=1 Tax=Chenopodium quinoa TaxID=63459 RepID=UPI000B775DE0|nr:uncharacterized protein LOC110686882 [Chenopodium quinoa]
MTIKMNLNRGINATHQPQTDKVSWKRLVCINQASLKSIFITWLALQSRIVTKDRLIQWNINCDPLCFFCQKFDESVAHLFFSYSYSREIWQKILGLLKIQKIVQSFDLEQQWATRYCRKSSRKCRLYFKFFVETVHNIWFQRNNLIFNGSCQPADLVFKDIDYRVVVRCTESDRKFLYL